MAQQQTRSWQDVADIIAIVTLYVLCFAGALWVSVELTNAYVTGTLSGSLPRVVWLLTLPVVWGFSVHWLVGMAVQWVLAALVALVVVALLLRLRKAGYAA